MRATLYTADWVLPVTAPLIRNGAVLVGSDGAIAAVGPADAIDVGRDVERIGLGSAVLMPGLVNVHTHPELAAMRGLLEDLPFHEWIATLRALKDRAALTYEDFALAARWTCFESIAHGITTMGATEDSGAALEAMRLTGMRGIVYREVFGPAPGQAGRALQKLRGKVDEMRMRETELVRVGVSPHAPYTVSDELFEATARYALDESLPLAVHAGEAEVERLLVTAGQGVFAAGLRTRGIATPPRAASSLRLLQRTGVLDTAPLLIHCVLLDDEDIRIAAAYGAAVAHCPVANARLGHGIAPVVEMLAAGVNVGIGTDSVASNNRTDVLEEARIAQLMQRARLASAAALPPTELLRLVTIDAAGALRCDARAGSLEVGKDADLCAVGMTAPHTRPVIDPVAALFHSARGADVVLTAVRGRLLYRDGRFIGPAPMDLRDGIDMLGRRLQQARDVAQ
jgi:cytosine/adenosine deaminase-related metal-dependent hydrolase